ncbi:MAG: gliding motility-associated C-terminal domain-containing protein, partial [Chitinophagales bacterium]|nr:gliding motility-associated C-terminal domain-containing protein [Chitinophagales bacterium]
IISINLQLVAPVFGNRTVSICENDSFYAGGAFQSAAGFFIDTIQSASGCDSILTTELQLIVAVFTNLNALICEGDSIFLGGKFQKQPGVYNDTLNTVAGCDSIIQTNLQLIVPVYSTTSVNICLGDSILAGGGYQSQPGTYNDTLSSSSGCDSILTTIVQIILPVFSYQDVLICYGESYYCGGAIQTSSGTYSDTLITTAGCDSIRITDLEVISPVYGSQDTAICDGDSYYAGGMQQSISGTYYDTLTSYIGCDSILTTQLTVLPLPMVYLGQDTSICEGSSVELVAGTGFLSYIWSNGSQDPGMIVNEAGSYWVEVTAPDGCTASDTLEIIQLYSNPQNFLPGDTSLCGWFSITLAVPGFSWYHWNNGEMDSSTIITSAGSYMLEVRNENGCVGTDTISYILECEKSLVMPNAFTPNGDGLNDKLKPALLEEITNYELTIFNRWGKLIFYSENTDFGWDGRDNNTSSPVEEYIWIIRYTNDSGEEKIEKGNVALLR